MKGREFRLVNFKPIIDSVEHKIVCNFLTVVGNISIFIWGPQAINIMFINIENRDLAE